MIKQMCEEYIHKGNANTNREDKIILKEGASAQRIAISHNTSCQLIINKKKTTSYSKNNKYFMSLATLLKINYSEN